MEENKRFNTGTRDTSHRETELNSRNELGQETRDTNTGLGTPTGTTSTGSTVGPTGTANMPNPATGTQTATTHSTHTTNEDERTMTVMFKDHRHAEDAYRALKDHGYKEEEISVIMSEDTRTKHYKGHGDTHKENLGNKSMEGAGTGSAIGGTLGAIVGAIAAIGTSVVLPGVGLVIAGPLAAGLAGAGAGGLAGGLIGALAGAGVPEERAKVYEQGVKDGNILLSFRPHSRTDADTFRKKFEDLHGQHIHY